MSEVSASSGLIHWNRSNQALHPFPSPGDRCLWWSGFFVNRRELITLTASPEEVPPPDLLLELYRRYGIDTPHLILGPIAWIIWDERNRQIIAVRDRLGTQEIYYTFQRDSVYLAGGLAPLLGVLPQKPRPDLTAIAGHVHGMQLPPGKTFYNGIQALQPGHLLILAQERIETRIYWQPEPQPVLRLVDDEAYADAFRHRALSVIAEYNPGEPAGVTLSGGLDSTTVAAALQKVVPSLTAFPWTAAELPEADESADAMAVAQILGLPVVAIPADQHWPLQRNPGILPKVEGPLFNLFTEGLEATYKAARERGIRILFSGFGGDSLFGGNVFSYPDLLLTGRWCKLAADLRKHLPHSRMGLGGILRHMILGPIAKLLIPSLENSISPPVPWLRPILQNLGTYPREEVPRWMLPSRRERLRMLRNPYLSRLARLTTAHAADHEIEFRHPLIDHRIIEFALSLPSTQTFRAAQRKVIVRNAMRGLLPDSVVERRDKIYPAAIARRGLRERETAKVWALMTNMRAAEMGFVNEARLREEYQRYLDGKTQSTLFWHTLTLEAWLRLYF